jgi:hypothetical protein
MSQIPYLDFVRYEDLAEFLQQLCVNSDIEFPRISAEPIRVFFHALKSTGDGEFDKVIIDLWLERCYTQRFGSLEYQPDLSRYLITKFYVYPHHKSSILIPHLEGDVFLRKIGHRVATRDEFDTHILTKNASKLYSVRSEDNLRSFFERYIWYSRYYHRPPIFKLI